MKVSFLVLIATLIVTACSAPKYTASFQDYHHTPEYASTASAPENVIQKSNPDKVVLASTSALPVKNKTVATSESISINTDKKQQKAAIRQLRADVKEYVKEHKSQMRESSYQDFQWDNDLKLAAIFGAAGLVGVLLGGISVAFSIIGGIALIIAVVFFVQWVIRQ